MHILIVEDQIDQSRTLERILKPDYAVDVARTVAQGRYAVSTAVYDLILLDIGLPDAEGIQLCSYIRAQEYPTYILMLTARMDILSKVRSLDQGADDYLVKPFAKDELLARIRALLRRPRESLQPLISLGELTINFNTRQAYRQGNPLRLAAKQFSILEQLVRQVGNPVSRNSILEHCWDRNADAFSNIVDVHIKLLRDQLDRPYEYKMLKTVSGVGYQLLPIPPFQHAPFPE
jgi:DNA-binding response OmpR family regulator